MGVVRKNRSQIYELMSLFCFVRLLKPASRLVGDWLYGDYPITTISTTTITTFTTTTSTTTITTFTTSTTTTTFETRTIPIIDMAARIPRTRNSRRFFRSEGRSS